MRLLIVIILLAVRFDGVTQITFPYNGVLPKDVTSVVFINANVYIDYQTLVENGSLLIEKGKVIAAGKGVIVPENAVVIDLKGKFIYPSFIDMYTNYGLTAPAAPVRGATTTTEKGAFGWNDAIKSSFDASRFFSIKSDMAKELRSIGFGTALSNQMDGIDRGTAAVVGLSSNPNTALIKSNAAAFYSFNKGTSPKDYPSSLMGSIALLRQTYYDAQWYAKGGNTLERNISLEAFNQKLKLPSVFDAGDKWNVLRADEVGDEFGVQYIIKTNGDEYQRISDIKSTKAHLIVPLAFPEAFDVSDPYLSRLVGLDEMKHWELAPTNCSMLYKENISFCLTSHGLSDKNLFLKNLRLAVKNGLPEKEALKSLTENPASFLMMQSEIGALKNGMWANFLITSKNIFDETSVIYENWVQGEQNILESMNKITLIGEYKLILPKNEYVMKIKDEEGKMKSTVQFIQLAKTKDGVEGLDTLIYVCKMDQQGQSISFTIETKDNSNTGILRFAGDMDSEGRMWKGRGQSAGGEWFDWSCIRQPNNASLIPPAPKDNKKSDMEVGEVIYPFVAYGWTNRPTQENVLITNTTIWTCEKEGIIENGQLLISNGKIVAVGKEIPTTGVKDLRIIDAKGKHVTPGIIDEHSHIALASVNEGAQASSAEVKESSVVWPEDIDIYRQLSGGVTTAQLLHGSANPIGGQSALVKMHWGGNANDMLIDGVDGFIKFALGENVKQSNWNNDGSRFPQTRMGVEQIYYDHFIRAREYGDSWKIKSQTPSVASSKKIKKPAVLVQSIAPRKDLEMEALNEILEKKRFITCHSYVQSEINMLMHVADSMNFTINTFTHILEGYKIADKIKKHGAGASSFSDWWAYKFEVKDAIPHNGALMWEQGITVAFNSDDAEMGRRLNQEAAKAVKYGGVPEEEALKFVTLNPAKLLHLDNRTGSIAKGKDADVVVWSDHPLSIYAKVEQTFVDGICYYDINQDAQMRAWMSGERARLIQKMLNAKENGAPVQQPSFKDKKHFHCDTIDQTGAGISFKY